MLSKAFSTAFSISDLSNVLTSLIASEKRSSLTIPSATVLLKSGSSIPLKKEGTIWL